MSDLSLYLVTYNCGRAPIKPEAFASHIFDALPDATSDRQLPDLIVLHLQEIAPLADGFSPSSLPQYYDRFKTAVDLAVKQQFGAENSGYVDLTTGNAGLTAIMLFVRTHLKHRIEHVMSAGVGVGVQKMGNKGAVGLRIAWRLTDSTPSQPIHAEDVMNLTFVSAHLAPAEDAWERRNQDFLDIARGLVFEPQDPIKTSPTSARIDSTTALQAGEDQPLLSADSSDTDDPTNSSSNLTGIYAPDAHLFFSGDLNYRTSNKPPANDDSDIKFFPQPSSSPSQPRHYSHLLPQDQLSRQRQAAKVLHGLNEEPITFPPTYKYSSAACAGKDLMLDSDVTEWKWATHRWPSWCDRILYSPSSSPDTTITVNKYTALPLLATSDHRPVALSATVPLRPVMNHDFAAHRPVELDPNWKASRDAARLKEAVVGAVWYSVSTTDGLLNVTLGLAAVVCLAVLTAVYAKEW